MYIFNEVVSEFIETVKLCLLLNNKVDLYDSYVFMTNHPMYGICEDKIGEVFEEEIVSRFDGYVLLKYKSKDAYEQARKWNLIMYQYINKEVRSNENV